MGTTVTKAGQPLLMTVQPSGVKVPEGFGTYHGSVKFTNDGHSPVTLHTELIKFVGPRACTGKPVTWLTVKTGNAVTVEPTHSYSVAYVVHASHGVTGSAAVVAEAAGPKTSAGTIGGAVGSRITVGSGAQQCAVVHAAAPHTGSGTSPILWAVIGLAVLLVAAGVLVARKIRRGNS